MKQNKEELKQKSREILDQKAEELVDGLATSSDTDQHLQKGYYIGAGAIESSNKTILQKRLKQSGIR